MAGLPGALLSKHHGLLPARALDWHSTDPSPCPLSGTIVLAVGGSILIFLLCCTIWCYHMADMESRPSFPVAVPVVVRQMSDRLQKGSSTASLGNRLLLMRREPPSVVVMMTELRERFELNDAAQLGEVEVGRRAALCFCSPGAAAGDPSR